MTDKQDIFVREYLVDLNATRAAIRAGYSENSARTIASELMAKPEVWDAIAKAKEERNDRTRVSADRVVLELARIAFSDLRKFCKWHGTSVEFSNSEGLSDDDAACVEEVSETPVKDSGSAIKIKLHSKIRALELLGKHTGAFDLEDDKPKNFTINLAYPLEDKKEAKP